MSTQYVDHGVPLLRSQDVRPFALTLGQAKRVTPEFHARLRKSALVEGDVVVVRTGYPGTAAVVPSNVSELNCADLVVIRPGVRLDPWFLAAHFNSRHGRALVGGQLVGSAQQHFNVGVAANMQLSLPNLQTQRRIGSLVRSFRDLIEINERRIELLEDLARSLYREWFVYFRFPGHEDVELVDSELGPIPEGWHFRQVGHVATLHRRSTKPGDTPETTFEHFSVPAFDSRALPASEPGNTIKSTKYRVEGESVLLSKLNPRFPRVWFALPSSGEAIASTEFLVWTGVEVSNAWLWGLFMDDAFRRTLVGSAGGTSTSHQRFKPADVANRKVALAPAAVVELFDAVADPALRQAMIIRDQNRQLAATRDLLLPRLVTGRLDISHIDLGVLNPTEAA